MGQRFPSGATSGDPSADLVVLWTRISHGYLLVDVTPDRVQGDWYFVDTILRPSDGVRFAESYAVPRGARRLHRVGEPVGPRHEPAAIG
jgi:phosphodiesterase/alkaline phosphatase D-like protein